MVAFDIVSGYEGRRCVVKRKIGPKRKSEMLVYRSACILDGRLWPFVGPWMRESDVALMGVSWGEK